MDADLKRRLVGATVLIVAALIFVPMLFDDEPKLASETLPVDIPAAPERDFESRVIPLDESSTTPSSLSDAIGVETNTPPRQDAKDEAEVLVDGQDGVADSAINSNAQADAIATVETQVSDRVDAITGETLNETVPSDTVTPSLPPNSSTPPKPTAQVTPVPTSTPASTSASTPASTKTVVVETQKPTASETISPTAAAGRYLVNFGSFSKRENANLVINALKAKGIRAYTETISVNGQPAIRLRGGPFAQRAEAEKVRLLAKMARGDIQPSVIERDDTAQAVVAAAKPSVASTSAPATSIRAADTTAFAVQVGAFSSEADAKSMQAKLRGASFPAYIEKINAEAGMLWRVRVGPSPTRERAEQLLSAVKQKTAIDGRVVTHP